MNSHEPSLDLVRERRVVFPLSQLILPLKKQETAYKKYILIDNNVLLEVL